MNFDKPFWASVMRESDGTASSARLLSAAIVASSLLWVTFLTYITKALPDLKPVGEFVCTTTLALYGVNRVAQAASDFAEKFSNSRGPSA